MILGIDRVVIAVEDPDAAAAELERDLGLEVVPGGRHEALGTFSRNAWFGDTCVDLIGVFDRALAEQSWIGGPTLRALATGGGLVTWAMATDDLDADAAGLRAGGSRLGVAMPGVRLRSDGQEVRWLLAAPPDLGRVSPFLIEHDVTAAEWTPADRADRAAGAHRARGPIRLEVLEVPVPDMNRAIQQLLRGAGLRVRPSLAGGGARDAAVGSQVVRVRPAGRDAPLTAVIRLAGSGLAARSVDLLGCRWVLRPG